MLICSLEAKGRHGLLGAADVSQFLRSIVYANILHRMNVHAQFAIFFFQLSNAVNIRASKCAVFVLLCCA